MAIRLLLADDADIVRRAIRYLLLPENDIYIVGEAVDVLEILPLTAETRPDVILMDLRMTRRSRAPFSPDIIKTIQQQGRLVLMTVAADEEAHVLVKDFGEVPLLDKGMLAQTLLPAVRGAVRENASHAGA